MPVAAQTVTLTVDPKVRSVRVVSSLPAVLPRHVTVFPATVTLAFGESVTVIVDG